jgi:hypothetical protein
VGDEVRIPIESRIEVERGQPGPKAAGDSAPPGRGSSARVVQEPSRWTRAAIVVAAVALVGAGIALVTRGDGGTGDATHDADRPYDSDQADGASDRGAEELPAEPGAEPATPTPGGSSPQATTARAAFAEAVLRLERAGSFTYQGRVHAAAASPFRPGTWISPDVTVQGEVMLPHVLTHEVAVGPGGAAVETVTSGPTVWSRTAPGSGRLPGAEWAVEPSGSPQLPLGMAAVVGRLGRAHDPRGEAPDEAARRVIRGTFPMGDDGPFGELLSGADLLLTLHYSGDIARVVITSAPVAPELVMEIDITGLSAAKRIAVPDEGDAAIRRTVPLGSLADAGVSPVELAALPEGWTLVGAWVAAGAAGPEECPVLNLLYRDPARVFDGYMALGVMTGTCSQGTGPPIGRDVPFTAGSLVGTAVVSRSHTAGRLSDDGDLAVEFATDLSVEDSSTVLASLVPFDVSTDPAPLEGISSP